MRLRRLLRRYEQLETRARGFRSDWWIGDPSHPQINVTFLGDSLMYGVGADRWEETIAYAVASELAVHKAHIHAVNKAAPKARVADILNTQLPGVTTDVIVLCVGSNDSSHFTLWKSYLGNWGKILDEFGRRQPRMVLIASSADISCIPAFPRLYGWFARRRCEQENRLVQELVRETSFRYVDLFHYGKLDYDEDPGLYADDLFHPSPKGYTKLTKVFLDELSSVPENQI